MIEIVLTEGMAQGDATGILDRGKVTFGKGTQCLTDIVTHQSCNCGESDINSSYRQCLVSLRSSTTYFTALTLFNTGDYTSFVNREVAKWLEQQDDMELSPKTSRHDTLR